MKCLAITRLCVIFPVSLWVGCSNLQLPPADYEMRSHTELLRYAKLMETGQIKKGMHTNEISTVLGRAADTLINGKSCYFIVPRLTVQEAYSQIGPMWMLTVEINQEGVATNCCLTVFEK
jgi:hypothetical protein